MRDQRGAAGFAISCARHTFGCENAAPPIPSGRTRVAGGAASRRGNEAATARPDQRLDDRSTGDEAVDDYDHGDHEKKMDQAAADIHNEEAQNPQNEQNYRDRPKHDGILTRSEIHLGADRQYPGLCAQPQTV